MMKLFSFVWLLQVVAVESFHVPLNGGAATQQQLYGGRTESTHAVAPPSTTTTSALHAKRPTSDDEDSTLDYGKIAGMLFNPLNPYSWFLYFFIGIFTYSAIQ